MNCKNCGAELFEQNAVDGVIECEYCFSRYPVARKEASPAALEFMRMGEHDLDTGRFDDAYAAYEKAAEIDKEEPEACFGMALALFKVQYIKDEVNNRLQPICHELTEKRFQEDSRYLSALRLGTEAQKKEYIRRAEEIDYIRSEFVELKNSGLDFDCFLCVKVTGADGEKTEDSKDADYIYDLLKDRGYKPFYSERNIRNRTGADYEAMILYALHTAETMLVICREEEYLQTPWVKNEYARFLRLLNDSEKESDAITVVYYEKPIEKLAGKRGKIQGIDFSRRDADRKICDFVESHTAEAKAQKQREEEEKKKREELEARLKTVQGGGMSAIQQAINDQIDRLTEESRKAEQRREEESRLAYEKENDPSIQNYDREEFEIDGALLYKYKGTKRNVKIPRGVTGIENDAFKFCNKLTSVTIPDGVTSIGKNAFYGCSGLTNITIPESVTDIGEGAFDGCKALTNITIPDSVTGIGEMAFFGCSGFTSITLGNSVISIGKEAFWGCSRLKSITIPNSVTRIGIDAFWDCSGLTSVNWNAENCTSAGTYEHPIFEKCITLETIIFGKNVKKISSAFHGCNALTNMSVSEDNPNYASLDGILYNKDKTEIVCVPKAIRGVVTIPNSVKNIWNGAFRGCWGLTSITIGNSVTSILDGAFRGCWRLTSITIPDSVTSIAEMAFSECNSLTNITIPNSVTSIGNDAFSKCTSLKNVTMPKRFKKERKRFFYGCKKIKFTFTK